MSNREYGMGRLYLRDIRDEDYPIAPLLLSSEETLLTKRFWYSNGWWGNQGSTPHCVAYSLAHFLQDGPLLGNAFTSTSMVDTTKLYCEAQKFDPWPGDCNTPLYDGTTLRAGAKVLKDWGYIEEYRWAKNAAEIARCVLTQGPVAVGTFWREGMRYPDSKGMIRATGGSTGGHAYLINGVDMDAGYFRIKNSWGRAWGKAGHAIIPIEDMDTLINIFGEACVPIQKKL